MTEISDLTASVEIISEAVTKLAAACTQQHEELFTLPPPSFVPSLPDTPTVVPPPIVPPTGTVTTCNAARPPEDFDASTPVARAVPKLPRVTTRHVEEDREREHVREVLDEAENDEEDDGFTDDEAWPRLAPLTPIENGEHAHV